MDTWTTNGFILWSLTLFVLAWIFWRDARRRQDELATVVRSIIPDVLLVTDTAGKSGCAIRRRKPCSVTRRWSCGNITPGHS